MKNEVFKQLLDSGEFETMFKENRITELLYSGELSALQLEQLVALGKKISKEELQSRQRDLARQPGYKEHVLTPLIKKILAEQKKVRDPKTGQLLIDDVKGDNGYGNPIVDPAGQNKVIGNTNPDWIGSVISNLSYKGFTFGFQIAVRAGGQMWNGTRGAMDYFGTGADTKNRNDSTVFTGIAGHLDDKGNIVTTGAKNTAYGKTGQYYWQNVGSSFVGATEANVEDASFVKLRQISLTYAFPQAMITKTHLKNLSLTLFMNNVILWTAYKGVDPETSLSGPANGQGLDYFNNPSTKSYGIRLNIGL